jgi:hypothetical protein
MTMNDRIVEANARSRRVPAVLLRVLLAWIMSAIILAIAVPALRAQGLELRGWMAWLVILGSLGLCLGPLVAARRRP